MSSPPETVPDDFETLKAAFLAERAARREAEARASGAEAMVAHLKLLIAKLKRERFGPSSEHRHRLLDQLELQLEELEASATQDACTAEVAAEAAAAVKAAQDEDAGCSPPRRRPVRAPLPAHLPRERVVIPAPSVCPCCQGKLVKLGEDVTETLEVIPRQWKVIQTVREKFTCRSCEKIAQPPAPFHPIARGRVGAGLLAMVLYGKYGLHLPLNRQSEGFAREGIELDVSTLADWVGAVAASLQPLTDAIKAHVRAAARSMPTKRRYRCWRKARPRKAGCGRSSVTIGRSADRTRRPRSSSIRPIAAACTPSASAGYTGIMQADAFSGFGRLYKASRQPGPIAEAGCWAHARRGFFELAELQKGPIAIEAVKRIDALFAIEREINGASAEQRRAVRNERTRPLIEDLDAWLRAQRARLSAKSKTARAADYVLKRWPAFTRFLDDGRICLSNNAAERALRGIALGRRSWTFAGSDDGGRRAAAMYTLIETAKLNGIDPRAWLADVLARLPGHPASRIHELLPWHWNKAEQISAAA